MEDYFLNFIIWLFQHLARLKKSNIITLLNIFVLIFQFAKNINFLSDLLNIDYLWNFMHFLILIHQKGTVFFELILQFAL